VFIFEKQLHQLGWSATTTTGTSVEVLYSIDNGETFTSLGQTQGIYNLSLETTNTLIYKAILTAQEQENTPLLTSLVLYYLSEENNEGIFTSAIINAGQSVHWTNFTKEETKPSGTEITYYFRTGDSPIIDSSWSVWSLSNGTITSPENQYIQIKAVLESIDESTPILHSITINYEIKTKRNTSSGSSASSRYINLLNMGNDQAANELLNLYPNQIIPVIALKAPETENTNQILQLNRNLKLTKPLTKGNDVKELQNYLNQKGYNSGNADGIFGPKTKGAVIQFQLENGLVGDGIVGLLTKAKLN
jgi:hypothetical protein